MLGPRSTHGVGAYVFDDRCGLLKNLGNVAPPPACVQWTGGGVNYICWLPKSVLRLLADEDKVYTRGIFAGLYGVLRKQDTCELCSRLPKCNIAVLSCA